MAGAAGIDASAGRIGAGRSAARGLVVVYAELTKARLSALVVFTTALGFVLASPADIDWGRLGWALLGTTLAAFGANALNQCLEVERDRRMRRTRLRPLPAGEISRGHAAALGAALAGVGSLVLMIAVNPLTAVLAIATVLIYVGLYTPLKALHSSNTLVGAVCGAIPPMMGWSAATGTLAGGAWLVGLLLFAWQIPHFLALAWMYREDYARGGFRMLPAVDPSGRTVFRLMVLYSVGLFPLGLAFGFMGLSGWISAGLAAGLAGLMIASSARLARSHEDADARRAFFASVIYLPVLMILLMIDRIPAAGLG